MAAFAVLLVRLTGHNGDTIYNAADDNASGSAGNLAIARALVQGPPPRRSACP